MKRKIFPIFLIISALALNGCAMLSPFKSINTCADTKNNGAACASVESNLVYSVEKDEKTSEAEEHSESSPEVSSFDAEKTKDAADIGDSGEKAATDEIRRLAAELNENASFYEKPVFLPAKVYRMLVFPYSSGDRFYSARYVYITAGKTGWISGGYAITDGKYRKIDVPARNARDRTTTAGIRAAGSAGLEAIAPGGTKIPGGNIKSAEGPDTAPKKSTFGERCRVAAYYLNCRDMPGIEGRSLKILKRGDAAEIAEKSGDWWKIYASGEYCYVNSAYLEEEN